MLVNTYHNCPLRAKNFCTNIVSIECVTAHLDVAEGPTGKTQINDSIVDITDGLKNFADKRSSFRRDTFNFAPHEPAGEIKVMNCHIDNQPTTLRRVRVEGIWAEWVTTNRFEGDRRSNLATINQCLCFFICSVEATHETNLEWDLRSCNSIQS